MIDLWKDNRLDGHYQMPVKEIAEQFVKSKIWDETKNHWPLERAVRVFLTTELNSVFEEKQYPIIHEACRKKAFPIIHHLFKVEGSPA